jgi:hypothetical protein
MFLRRLAVVSAVLASGALYATGAAAVTLFDAATPGRLLAERPDLEPLHRDLDLSGFDLCGSSGMLSTNVGIFARAFGPAGAGESICGDTTTPQVKDGTLPNLFGRFNPFPERERWIDSNDLTDVDWVIDTGELGLPPLAGLEFALIDAHDQPIPWVPGADSFFFLLVDGVQAFSIPDQLPNANVIWITLLFDEPVTRTTLTFVTRHNDGWGVANATLAPIPLPPALALLGGGLVLLAGFGRRRTRA